MDTPQDICNKYCKHRLQRVVADTPCPFELVKSEVEGDKSCLTIKTICEGYVTTLYKTIIERISKITEKGVEILKEIIKHERVPTVPIDLEPNNFPTYPGITLPSPPLNPNYPNSPWTWSGNTSAFKTIIGEANGTPDKI